MDDVLASEYMGRCVWMDVLASKYMGRCIWMDVKK